MSNGDDDKKELSNWGQQFDQIAEGERVMVGCSLVEGGIGREARGREI